MSLQNGELHHIGRITLALSDFKWIVEEEHNIDQFLCGIRITPTILQSIGLTVIDEKTPFSIKEASYKGFKIRSPDNSSWFLSTQGFENRPIHFIHQVQDAYFGHAGRQLPRVSVQQ